MDVSKLRRNKLYSNILTKIHEKIPTAIIAGGAIRDLCHNKPVHDIDIYVPLKPAGMCNALSYSEDEDYWISVFDLDGDNDDDYIEDTMDSGDEGDYDGKNFISKVWEIQSDGILYNIIVVEIDPIKYVETCFDIGLCKAWFDGKRFRLSAEFITDSTNKTLTVVAGKMPQDDFNHMMRIHVPKLQKKYPGHNLVIPTKYEKKYDKFKTLRI